MKYEYDRSLFIKGAFAFAVIGVIANLGLLLIELRGGEITSCMDLVEFLLFYTLPVLLIVLFLLWLGLKQRAYAMMESDGIHLISRKNGEFGLLPWDLFVDCSYGPYSPGRDRVQYMVLITRWDAALHSKPANSFQGTLTVEELRVYGLDETMEAIIRGKLTVEELKRRPMLLLAAEQKQYDTWRSLWRAAVKGQGSNENKGG